MYVSGQSGGALRDEIRQALQRLEGSLAGHERRFRATAADGAGAPRDVMERLIAMMGEEVERLRVLLAQQEEAGP